MITVRFLGLIESSELASQFTNRDDEFWDVESNEDGESTFRGSGHSAVVCTGYACEIQRKLGDRVRIFGFDSGSNPGTLVGELADGHDFAVVDGRYIVDPWIREVEDLGFDKIVFDLDSGADKEAITKIYGDPANWEEMSGTL